MLESLRRVFTRKASATTRLQVEAVRHSDAVWTPRNYDDLMREGYEHAVWVYACVSWLTRMARGVTWLVQVGEDEPDEHPLLDLLNRPNDQQSGSAFMESAYGYWLIAGNSYIERVGTLRQPPVELWVKRPDRMKVIPDPRALVRGYQYEIAGQKHVFEAWQVRHLKTWSPRNDWYGMSPLEAAARGIDLFNVGQAHNLALMQNGARPSGAWVTQGTLTDDQYARLRREIHEASTNLRERGRAMLLEGGTTWQELGLRPRDLDWLAGQADAGRQIHAAYGIHPVVTGLSEGTYENQRQALRGLMLNTVLPFLDYFAGEVNEWLAPLYGENVRVKYDKDAFEVLSEDQESLWRRADIGWKQGFLTRNEARTLVGYDEVEPEKGDIFVNEMYGGMRGRDGLPGEGGEERDPRDGRDEDEDDEGEDEDGDEDEREGERGRGRGRGRRRRRRRQRDEGDGESEVEQDERRNAGEIARTERTGLPVARPLWSEGRIRTWSAGDELLAKRVVRAERFPVRDALDRERYWRSRVALQESWEKRWAAALERVFDGERERVLKGVASARSARGMLARAESAVHASGWESVLGGWWYAGLLAGGEETLMRVLEGAPVREKASVPDTAWFEFVFGGAAGSTASMARAHVPRLAGVIEDTTLQAVARIIEEGVRKGWSVPRIARALDELYLEDIIPNRSMVIARTETIRATNFGSQQAARGTGLRLEKVWLSTLDDRVRDSHHAAHGQVRLLDEPYVVGTTAKGFYDLMYPGDPRGPAHETIQCRCTEYYQEADDTRSAVVVSRQRARSDERAVVVSLEGDKAMGRVNAPLPSPAGDRVIIVDPERFRSESIQSAYEQAGVDATVFTPKLERLVNLRQDVITFEREYQEATDKKTENRAKRDQGRAYEEAERLEAELKADAARLREEVHEHLAMHNPDPVGVLEWQVGDTSTAGKGALAANREALTEAQSWLGRMFTRGPHVPEEPPVVNILKRGVRSAYDPDTGMIDMENREPADKWIHEYAHYVEARNPRVSAAAWDFFNRRTQGNPVEPLGEIASSQYPQSDEAAKRDGGVDAYTWRFYGEGQPHTEVFSMGLQMMYTDPVRFALSDPEHFDLTYRILRGEFGGDQ